MGVDIMVEASRGMSKHKFILSSSWDVRAVSLLCHLFI